MKLFHQLLPVLLGLFAGVIAITNIEKATFFILCAILFQLWNMEEEE